MVKLRLSVLSESEEVDEVLHVKDKLIRAIMTGILSLAGKLCPDFLYNILDELKVDSRTREVIQIRYIVGVKFESIPDLMKRRCELRQVFKIHKDFIDRLYYLVITYKRRS